MLLKLVSEKIPKGPRPAQKHTAAHGNSGQGIEPGKELVLIYIDHVDEMFSAVEMEDGEESDDPMDTTT